MKRGGVPAIRRGTPKSTSSRTQFSTSSLRRPKVCINCSTSKLSSGRELRYRNRPARSGDCTRLRKRVSTSCGSTVRAAVGAAPRRALKMRSSMYLAWLSADGGGSDRLQRAGCAGGRGAVMVGLVLLDQLLHAHRITLAMAVAENRVGAAAGLDQHVRQHGAGVDVDRRHVRHMYRLFLLSYPACLVLNDAGWCDRHLRRKQVIAGADAAGAEHLAGHERPSFAPHPPREKDDDRRRAARDPPQPRILASHQTRMLS